MRTSGPITTPVSLTPRNGESASLAEDTVSGRRCVGLNSGSAGDQRQPERPDDLAEIADPVTEPTFVIDPVIFGIAEARVLY